jgi:hypothetical protein
LRCDSLWLRPTPPAASPRIITVDAALIADHCASGSLGQLHAIARRMIAGGGPVIASWDAWTTADDGHRTSAIAGPPVRPAGRAGNQWLPALPDERRA